MSLAERQAKRTCHIDERERERESETRRERERVESGTTSYAQRTLCCAFCWACCCRFVPAKNKISSRRKKMVKGKATAQEKPA